MKNNKMGARAEARREMCEANEAFIEFELLFLVPHV